MSDPGELELLEGCTVGPTPRSFGGPETLPYVVLFASVLYAGREAIEARAAQWRALFGPRPSDG